MFSRFSRRHLLSVVSLTIAGTAVAISIPSLNSLFPSKAQAQEISEEVYKGRKYKIIVNKSPQNDADEDNVFDTSTELFLDDKKVKILRHKKTQKYVTPLLFGEFESPKKIAKLLIDLGLKLPNQEVKIDPNVD